MEQDQWGRWPPAGAHLTRAHLSISSRFAACAQPVGPPGAWPWKARGGLTWDSKCPPPVGTLDVCWRISTVEGSELGCHMRIKW